jgi:group I intron endonuclease
MPYTQKICGIYKVVNKITNQCYVGQSQNIKKRVHEHFRLMRNGIHPNRLLQQSFDQCGQEAFEWTTEVVCEDPADLDQIEEAFLQGDAWFEEKSLLNISSSAKAPMKDRQHSPEIKEKISKGRRAAAFNYKSEKYKKTLQEAQIKRALSVPEFVAKVRYIIDNPNMSYAERGRVLGTDTSSVRKIALKYSNLKGTL